jgi:hypothetical protein
MDLAFQPFSVPSTGQLRTDLIELLSRLVTLLNDHPFPRLMATFIDVAERDPTLSSLHAEPPHVGANPSCKSSTKRASAGTSPHQQPETGR